ncbi:MAG: hypothetical protein IH880_10715 [Candidatus Marinimicrobia bacterium]|nr:hypothetical protein [Candidatus Neomarinimicrobiota bacterium]
MFILLMSVSILLLVIGVVMVVSPKAANWLNTSGNIVILTEKKVLEHRFLSGVISLLFGVFFMYKASGYNELHTEVLVIPFYSIGILLTLVGIMFFMSTRFFESINAWTSKEMLSDKLLMKYPRVTGAFFVFSAVMVYFTAEYFK